MDWRLRIPSVLYRLARDRAGSDKELAERVRAWLERYASGDDQQRAAQGGHARAAKLSPDERRESARRAAAARWERPREVE
jgi:hypothetical protein